MCVPSKEITPSKAKSVQSQTLVTKNFPLDLEEMSVDKMQARPIFSVVI